MPARSERSLDAFLPLTATTFHVLLALVDEPRHGYGIMKQLEASSGKAVGPGTVYGALRRLAQEGLVREGEEREAERGRHPRQLFEITELGQQVLTAEGGRLAYLADLARAKDLVPEG
jgi:DNA-binding PadR family transcriptional regulator